MPKYLEDSLGTIPVQNPGRKNEKMQDVTKELLDKFYAVYNDDLAQLLHDVRFQWT